MKGWKTIAFNVLTGILLIVEGSGTDLGISPEMIAVIAVVGNFILRFFTTGPVGNKPQ